MAGLGQSMGLVAIFLVYAIGFGFGGILVARGRLQVGDLLSDRERFAALSYV